MSITINVKGQPVQLLDTDQLAVFHNKTSKIDTWLLDMFFPNRKGFNGKKVPIGELDTSTPIAPLVAPSVQGRVMVDRAEYNARYVPPAYLKPAGMITPENITDLVMLQTMQQAGIINRVDKMSPAEKLRVAQVNRFMRNRESITNFNVLMASEVLLKGKVTFKSEDFPEVTVDYERHAEMTFTPVTKWEQSNATPVTDIETMNNRLVIHSGTGARVALMSSKVFGAITKNDEFKERFVKSKGEFSANPLNVAVLNRGDKPQYRGELDGIQFWTWDATYHDENGAVKRYIGENSFHLIADNNGFLCNCSLQHLDVMDQPLEVYDYIVQEKDPSGIKLISESSPLAVPSMVNGVVSATSIVS